MIYPLIFGASATAYTTQGLGVLSDAIKCEVTEELNGQYELEMEYPLNGIHAEELQQRALIVVKLPYETNRQAFRIYRVSEPLNDVLTVNARHLSYDLSGYPVSPFTAANLANAITGLISNSMVTCPFTITTNKTVTKAFKVDVPSSVRSWFGDKEGSLIDLYKGEWHFDNFTCELLARRGTDRGVTIRYGKNLTDFTRDEESTSQYTHIIGFYSYVDDQNVETLVNGSLISLGTFSYTKALCLDCSEHFGETAPTVAEINTYVTSYAENNNLADSRLTVTLDFVQLADVKEHIELGDTVRVYNNGVTYTARCIMLVWDALRERYTKAEIGKPRQTFYSTVKRVSRQQAANAVTVVKKDLVTYTNDQIELTNTDFTYQTTNLIDAVTNMFDYETFGIDQEELQNVFEMETAGEGNLFYGVGNNKEPTIRGAGGLAYGENNLDTPLPQSMLHITVTYAGHGVHIDGDGTSAEDYFCFVKVKSDYGVQLDAGEKYTFSCDLTGNVHDSGYSSVDIRCGCTGATTEDIATVTAGSDFSQRVVFTFTATAAMASSFFIQVYTGRHGAIYTASNRFTDWFHVENMKLEKGDTATAWCAAAADYSLDVATDSDINDLFT